MARVLVTGASGMLGAAVAAEVERRGHDVTVMQRRSAGGRHREALGDIRDQEAVARAVSGQDAVVHLAAKVDVVGPRQEFEAVNVGGTRNILSQLRRRGGGSLVFVSSPSVAHGGRSLVGVGAGAADVARARGHYARTKAAAEQLVLLANDSHLPVVAVRPHLVWGPGDTQLVGRIAERARHGRLALVGSGAALVDTTYVDNAASAIACALDRVEHVAGEAFVVTNGEPRPIGELVAGICRAVGAPAPRVRVPFGVAWGLGALVEGAALIGSRLPGGGMAQPPMTRFLAEQLATAHWFDQRRTREALDWRPHVTLDEGFDLLARSASG